MKTKVDRKRVHVLSEGKEADGPVIYWMSRDQRIRDNWALLFAREIANEKKVPLVVLFCLASKFLGAVKRQYAFMLRGLVEIANDLDKRGIPFILRQGDPADSVLTEVASLDASTLVADFNPLRISREWKEKATRRIRIPFYEVDTHNIIPCRIASDKQEFAARTFRPKVNKLLPEFLTDFSSLRKPRYQSEIKSTKLDINNLLRGLRIDSSVDEVDWIKPGEKAARAALKRFIQKRLPNYANSRNNPVVNMQSDLSPYLHFGQISAQRVALEVSASDAPAECREAFLEELIVRRELSDSFCLYNKDYDSFDGFPDWAKKTLNDHRNDEREYLYSRDDLESARTHDDLWNAAQREMVSTGKMHGYLRMYWAKKILEWSVSPEEALDIAIYLNDRYELDGRDPNGYAGVAWSIGGVHDRAWNERPIFGKVRYMNLNGCKRKFDVDAFIQKTISLKD